LANAIIPEFNVIIVPPTVEAFVKVTERIIKNKKLRSNMAKNCSNLNEIFSKNRWERQIKNAIHSLL